MCTFLQDFGVGGIIPPDLGKFLQVSCSGNPLVWLENLGDDPQDQADSQNIPLQTGPPSGGNAAKVRHDRVVVVPPYGRRYGGGGP